MSSIAIKKLPHASTLLQKLVDKVDNGDKTLTAFELERVNGGNTHKQRALRGQPAPTYKGVQLDEATDTALLAAINRAKTRADRSTAGIKKGIAEAQAEIKSADADGDSFLSDAEQKKVKTPLGKALLAFTRLHGGDSLSHFKIVVPDTKIYQPKTPFVAPQAATPMDMVDALVKHFNAFSNDNRIGPNATTRFVLGTVETKGIAAELAKLPKATAKAVLKAFEQRIQMSDASGFTPARIWVEPTAKASFDALAKALGLTANFAGNPNAPFVSYY